MLHGVEAFDRPPCHALGWRISRDEIGVLGFEPFEFVQQRVEFLVGDLRRVVRVIPLFVMTNGFAKLLDAFDGINDHVTGRNRAARAVRRAPSSAGTRRAVFWRGRRTPPRGGTRSRSTRGPSGIRAARPTAPA